MPRASAAVTTQRTHPPVAPGRRRWLQAALAAGLAGGWGLPGLAPAASAAATLLTGRVLAVQDGDTFELQTADGRRLRIRIAAIDAPERRQRFARRSREHLRELLLGHPVSVTVLKTDRYGRLIADVRSDERDVGLAQLEAGLAWHFRRYAVEQPSAQRRVFELTEQRARQRRAGLWRDDTPVAPWQYREQARVNPRVRAPA